MVHGFEADVSGQDVVEVPEHESSPLWVFRGGAGFGELPFAVVALSDDEFFEFGIESVLVKIIWVV